MQEFLSTVWFSIGAIAITYGQIIGALGFGIAVWLIYWYTTHKFLPSYFTRHEHAEKEIRRIGRIFTYLLWLIIALGTITILGFNLRIVEIAGVSIRVSTVIQAVLILHLARLLDWIISRVFLHSFFERRDDPVRATVRRSSHSEESATKTVQFAVYVIAAILILRTFNIDRTIYQFQFQDGVFDLKFSNIFIAILIVLIGRLLVWFVIQIILYAYYRRKNVDVGSQYAFNQLLKYVVYTLAILIAVQQLGVNPTLIWGGLAALLVGIGLGLQQTFNDFFSGIILLFERSVEIGDVLEVDGMVGTVKRIGIRASLVETRDNLSVVVPNSHLVTKNVINWSHYDSKVRFHVSVGVAYGSDTELVREVLLSVARDNKEIFEHPAPFVRFIDFQDSSLAFELHFWTQHFLMIEDVKSAMRMEIDRRFRQEGVVIPFPQRDVWMREA